MNEPLLTSEEWQAMPEFSTSTILDPDGWRSKDAPNFYTDPITRKEFVQRKIRCTVLLKLNKMYSNGQAH